MKKENKILLIAAGFTVVILLGEGAYFFYFKKAPQYTNNIEEIQKLGAKKIDFTESTSIDKNYVGIVNVTSSGRMLIHAHGTVKEKSSERVLLDVGASELFSVSVAKMTRLETYPKRGTNFLADLKNKVSPITVRDLETGDRLWVIVSPQAKNLYTYVVRKLID